MLSTLRLKILLVFPAKHKLSVVEVDWAKCLLLSSLTFIQKILDIQSQKKNTSSTLQNTSSTLQTSTLGCFEKLQLFILSFIQDSLIHYISKIQSLES